MLPHPYQTMLIGREHLKELLREANQERLYRRLKNFDQTQEWLLPALYILATGILIIIISH